MQRIVQKYLWRNNQLRQTSKFAFSNQENNKRKVHTVGFTHRNIQNIKNLSYKLKEPIKYQNGQFLLYKSAFSLFRTIRDYFLYLLGFSYLSYLFYNKVNFDNNPIIKHVYVGCFALLGALFARKYIKNSFIVKEVFLLQGGRATKIVFQNQFKRKMFGEPLQSVYYNSLFVQPARKQDDWISMGQFPHILKDFQQKSFFGSYWKKVYSNNQNVLLIPKQYKFANEQLLVQVMNGKIITS